ncbi:MAG: nuclear transport factor 2 family protein [Verrucomicrobiota bacterium]
MTALDPIQRYFAAANDRRIDDACACFSADAHVHDESNDHHGTTEIRAWIEETGRQYQPQVVVLRTVGSGDKKVVTVRVSGNFPGSPVELDFDFTLANGTISTLSIE